MCINKMVKVVYCDRCNEELKRTEKWDQDIFDDVFDRGDWNFDEVTLDGGDKIKVPKKIMKVQLCQSCLVGYNKIVNKANLEVKSYLTDKDSRKKEPVNKKPKEAKIKKKKFGLF